MSNTFMYVCSKSTEQECLDKMLVGARSSYLKLGQVQPDDRIFLYNYETGKLFGEFVSLTQNQENLVLGAWDGDYTIQVQVDWKKQYKPLTRPSFSDFINIGKNNLPPKVLSEEQYEKLIDKFKSDIRLEYTELDYRLHNPGGIMTEDGHRVRSKAEEKIDNWLYFNDVNHAYEKPLSGIASMCDFYLPKQDLYIEFWGLNTKKYLENKEQKIKYYKKNNLRLLEILPRDIRQIEKKLKEASTG